MGTNGKISGGNDYSQFALKLGKMDPPPEKSELYLCNKGYLIGSATWMGIDYQDVNRYYLKTLVCGREWCPHCGRDYSLAHSRRIVKAFPRLQQLGKKVGYLVVTVPMAYREAFKDIKVLRDFKTYWKRKLKRKETYQSGWEIIRGKEGKKSCKVKIVPRIKTRMPYDKGFIRYHYAGEDGQKWHPHINILIPAGFLNIEILNKWRSDVELWFANYFQSEEIHTGNIFYAYTKDPGKIKHWLNYITRSTWKRPGDQAEAQKMLYNFRNTTFWGKFEKTTGGSAGTKVLHSICPVINQPIEWAAYTTNRFMAVMYDVQYPDQQMEELEHGVFMAVGTLQKNYVKTLGRASKKQLEPYKPPELVPI